MSSGSPKDDVASLQDDGYGMDPHAQEVEEREAYEYWGYMFKSDKTGTDKLKSLLRALKNLINDKYETSDHPGQPEPDLTPNQLGHFYRDLHGNYDQLFLGTPHESIAFIYKSLGCLHSLQPEHHSHAIAFTDPTVPALKTEGWIMWQTIQLLLGPEEHAGFLREAVQVWDVKDPETGELFPKILPRRCFPEMPDKHMVAWYEGVSERLRKEAEDEERLKTIEVEHERDPPPRRSHALDRRRGGGGDDEDEVETESVDSRAPAIAYFRNPLYRHGADGRPSIVREHTKRPPSGSMSPRQTMLSKGKGAATAFGNVVKHVGSPHLWDGGKRSDSQNRERRRRSNASGGDGRVPTSRLSDSHLSRTSSGGHRRRGSQQVDRNGAGSGVLAKDDRDSDFRDSGIDRPRSRIASRSRRPSQDERAPGASSHSRQQTPDQRHIEDYFTGYDNPKDKPQSPSTQDAQGTAHRARSNSQIRGDDDATAAGLAGAAIGATAAAAAAAPASTSVNHESHVETPASPEIKHEHPDDQGHVNSEQAHTGPAFGPSFEPSTSPLFASHLVHRQPQPFQPFPPSNPQNGHLRPPSAGSRPLGPTEDYRNSSSMPRQEQFSPGPDARRHRGDDEHNDQRYNSTSPRQHGGPHPPPGARDRRSGRPDGYDAGPSRPESGFDRRRHRDSRDDDRYDQRPGSSSGRPFSPNDGRREDRRQHRHSRDFADRGPRYVEGDREHQRHRAGDQDRDTRDRDRRGSDRLSAADVPSSRRRSRSALSGRRGAQEPDEGPYSPPPPRDDRQRSDFRYPEDEQDDGPYSPVPEDERRPPPPQKQTRFAMDPAEERGYDDRDRRPKEDIFDSEDEDHDDRRRSSKRSSSRRGKSRSRSRRGD